MNLKKGFTLIELLVVIAIIAILAAILFPVFANAREKARQSSCLSNTKQLSMAINLYSDDYDESLPSVDLYNYKEAVIVAEDGSKNFNPILMCKDYIKNTQISMCPSDNSKWKRAKIEGTDTKAGNSYCYNMGMVNVADVGIMSVSLVSLNSIKKPSQFILMVDGDAVADCLTHYPGSAALRHIGGFNVGFADGHSKYYKAENDANGNPIKRPWPNSVNKNISNFSEYPLKVHADCKDENACDKDDCRECALITLGMSLM